jgi:hypothetical protein
VNRLSDMSLNYGREDEPYTFTEIVLLKMMEMNQEITLLAKELFK